MSPEIIISLPIFFSRPLYPYLLGSAVLVDFTAQNIQLFNAKSVFKTLHRLSSLQVIHEFTTLS